MFKKLLLLLYLVPILLLSVAQGYAASSKGGITITPPFQEVLILPNQTSVPGSFAVANNSSQPSTFSLSTVDMGALDDTGGVVFSGLSADYQQKYGLAHWLKLDTDKITIQPKSSAVVGFSIQNNSTLGPGGHYGAIIVKSTDQNSNSKNQVNLAPQAASLLFVRKVGGEIYNLKLEPPTSKTYLWKLPTSATVRLRNDGNIHVVPRGIVMLKDHSGREVSRGVINPESSLILPEHVRDFSVVFMPHKRLLLPGTYTISVSYRFEGSDKFVTQTYSIRFLNLPLIGLGLILLITLILLIKRFGIRLKRRITKISHMRMVKKMFKNGKAYDTGRPTKRINRNQSKPFFFWPTRKRKRIAIRDGDKDTQKLSKTMDIKAPKKRSK